MKGRRRMSKRSKSEHVIAKPEPVDFRSCNLSDLPVGASFRLGSPVVLMNEDKQPLSLDEQAKNVKATVPDGAVVEVIARAENPTRYRFKATLPAGQQLVGWVGWMDLSNATLAPSTDVVDAPQSVYTGVDVRLPADIPNLLADLPKDEAFDIIEQARVYIGDVRVMTIDRRGRYRLASGVDRDALILRLIGHIRDLTDGTEDAETA